MFGPSVSLTRPVSHRSRLAARAAGLVGVAFLFAVIGGAQEKPAAPASSTPENKPAEYVGSTTCQMCHEDIFNAFQKNPHQVVETDKKRGFVVDDRGFANIILGRGIPPPPASDKGHFHTESSEFWFILLGQIRYTMEGLPTFVADQGDIVYVPKQRWHLASLAGDGMSARLAMNGYPDLAHSFEERDSTR